MPEASATTAPEQMAVLEDERLHYHDHETVSLADMPEADHGHEHYLHDARCGHSTESAGHVADDLFDHETGVAHSHSHEGHHECDAHCAHSHTEATDLANELFTHNVKPKHHNENKSHEHDHDCATTCQASTNEAAHHAHDLFDEKHHRDHSHEHQHGGHGPECAHCQHSSEQATQVADRLFAEQDTVRADAVQEQMVQLQYEAIVKDVIGHAESSVDIISAKPAKTIAGQLNVEPVDAFSEKQPVDTVEPTPAREQAVVVDYETDHPVAFNIEAEIILDTEYDAMATGEEVRVDHDFLAEPVSGQPPETLVEHIDDETVVRAEYVAESVDTVPGAEIDPNPDSSTPFTESAITSETCIHMTPDVSEVVASIAPALQRVEAVQISLLSLNETLQLTTEVEPAVRALKPVVQEFAAIISAAPENPEIAEQVARLVERLSVTSQTWGIELAEIVATLEKQGLDAENAQLLYEILDGRRHWQSIEHSSEFNGSVFIQASNASIITDPRLLGQLMLNAFGRIFAAAA